MAVVALPLHGHRRLGTQPDGIRCALCGRTLLKHPLSCIILPEMEDSTRRTHGQSGVVHAKEIRECRAWRPEVRPRTNPTPPSGWVRSRTKSLSRNNHAGRFLGTRGIRHTDSRSVGSVPAAPPMKTFTFPTISRNRQNQTNNLQPIVHPPVIPPSYSQRGVCIYVFTSIN